MYLLICFVVAAKDGLECAQASVFRVTDTRGETLFSADRSKVIVGAQELRVTGNTHTNILYLYVIADPAMVGILLLDFVVGIILYM